MEILGAGGPGDLHIVAMCERLGVTRGSFYHHFESWDGFVEALLAEWEDRHATTAMRMIAEMDPGDSVRSIREFALELPHDAEVALRAWAATNRMVADAVTRVDRLRAALLAGALLQPGIDEETAAVIAEFSLGALIGFQHVSRPVDQQTFNRNVVILEGLMAARFPDAGFRPVADLRSIPLDR